MILMVWSSTKVETIVRKFPYCNEVFSRQRRALMLSTMKMEWSERDPATGWVVGIEDTTKL